MQNEPTHNTRPWLDKTAYPFEPHFLELPMGRMHYVDEGKGDPIVFVHGNPGWSFEFRNQIKALRATHRCIAPDHIGFGLSDKPYEWDYLPKSQAANFEQLMDSLDLNQITLVVSDWGGPIALSYALRYPEKIKRLVILNTMMWALGNNPTVQKFSSFFGGPIGIFLSKNFNFFARVLSKQTFHDKSKFSKLIHQHMYKHLGSPRERKGTWVFPKQIIASGDWLNSLWEQREQIADLPTHLVWGMNDIAFSPKDLATFEGFLTNYETIRLDNVGHYPQEERAEVLIEVLKQQPLHPG